MADERSIVYSVELDTSNAEVKLSAFSTAFERLGGTVDSNVSAFDTAFDKMGATVTSAGQQMSMFDTAFSAMSGKGVAEAGKVSSALENIGDTAQSVAADTSGALDSVASSAQSMAEGAASAAQAAAEGATGAAQAAAEGAASAAQSAADTASSALDEMGSSGQSAADAVSSAMDSVSDAAAGASERVASSASVFEKVGNVARSAMTGASNAIKGTISVIDTIKTKFGQFHNAVTTGATKLKNAFMHPIEMLKQKFSPGLQNAQKETANLGKEGEQAKGPFDRLAEAGDKIGASLKKAAAMVLSFKGLKTIVNELRGLLNDVTSRLKESASIEGQFEVLAKGTNAKQFTSGFAGMTNKSELNIMESLVNNTSFFQKLGIAKQDALLMGENLTTLATNLQTKFSLKDGEAESNLQEMLGGNLHALENMGIAFEKADLEAKSKQFFKKSYDKLEESQRVYLLHNALIDEAQEIDGYVAGEVGKASKTLAQADTRYDDAIKIANDDMGKALEPGLIAIRDAVTGKIQELTPYITDAAAAFSGMITEAMPSITAATNTLIDTFLSPVIEYIGRVSTAMTPLRDTLASIVIPALGGLTEDAGKLFETILPDEEAMSQVTNTLNNLLTGILGDGSDDNKGFIKEALGNLTDRVAQALPDTDELGTLLDPFNIAIEGLFGDSEEKKGVLGQALESANKIASYVIDPIKGLLEGSSVAIGGVLGTLLSTLESIIVELEEPVGTALTNAVNLAKQLLPSADDINKLSTALDPALAVLFGDDDGGKGLLSTAVEKANEIASTVIAPIQGLVENSVTTVGGSLGLVLGMLTDALDSLNGEKLGELITSLTAWLPDEKTIRSLLSPVQSLLNGMFGSEKTDELRYCHLTSAQSKKTPPLDMHNLPIQCT
ncbi:hypothetical protein FACS1894184_14570 [Clostridia bacterium]|nr:hypothetical protein FACS1894184_14570 [Clostridia bacterium]